MVFGNRFSEFYCEGRHFHIQIAQTINNQCYEVHGKELPRNWGRDLYCGENSIILTRRREVTMLLAISCFLQLRPRRNHNARTGTIHTNRFPTITFEELNSIILERTCILLHNRFKLWVPPRSHVHPGLTRPPRYPPCPSSCPPLQLPPRVRLTSPGPSRGAPRPLARPQKQPAGPDCRCGLVRAL